MIVMPFNGPTPASTVRPLTITPGRSAKSFNAPSAISIISEISDTPAGSGAARVLP